MNKHHSVQSVRAEAAYLYLTVDKQRYRIRWTRCSTRLAKATLPQRRHFEISPSGYGLHWPEIDEDLAITPLLQQAEVLRREKAKVKSAALAAQAHRRVGTRSAG
jgi:hypothetical protein